jgi:peptidoglycan L-alanyl-D-glutamate endopeptidase CwlK
MASKHLDKLAADLNIFKGGKWLQSKEELQFAGDYWEKMTSGNTWGGNFKTFLDTPHFEAA